MQKETMLGKILRLLAIVLLGLTAVFSLLGGIGTSCVALAADKYGSMAVLAPYCWLYIVYVLAGIAAGIWGLRALVRLARGKPGAYREALIALVVILIPAALQMITSELLRGASAPANMRVYFTLLTLFVFLLFKIPWLWNQVRFSRPSTGGSEGPAGGLAMIACGIMILTSYLWNAATHTIGGFNYASVWVVPLGVLGGLLVLGGLGLLAASNLAAHPAFPSTTSTT
jgi:hypothetical protein